MNTRRNPKTCRALALLATIALVTGAAAQSSAVPGLMAYQAYVTDDNNNPLGVPNPTNYDVVFRIYGSATGNELLWAEQQTVTIFQGNFSVLLGAGQVNGGEPRPPLDQVFTAGERYMGVTVNFGPSPTEFSPRQRILTNAYAYRARIAESVSGALNTTSSNVGIGTATPSELLHIRGGNDPTLLLQSDGSNEISGRVAMRQINSSGFDMYYDGVGTREGLAFEAFAGGSSTGVAMFLKNSNGFVGLGTTAPGRNLHIHGGSNPAIAVTENTLGAGATDGIQMGMNATHAWLWNYENIPTRFGTNNAERMRITQDGKVGIGTASPLAQFSVEGVAALSRTTKANPSVGITGGNGDRLVVQPATLGSEYPHSIGVNNAGMWYVVPASQSHQFYVGDQADVRISEDAMRVFGAPLKLAQAAPGGNALTALEIFTVGTAPDYDLVFTNGSASQNHIKAGFRHTSAGFLEASNRINVGGAVSARLSTAGWQDLSDRRTKRDIEPLDGLLEVALQLEPVRYWYNHDPANGDPARKRVGFIAQDVEDHLPAVVEDDGNLKTLSYSQLSTVAIGAVKEQHAIVAEQAGRIKALEKENVELRKRLDRIEQMIK